MEKKDKSFGNSLIAGVGGAIAGSVGKQLTAVDAHGGYAKNIQDSLNNLKVPPKLSYHLAGIAKRAPLAGLGSMSSLIVYKALQDKKEKDSLPKKLRNSVAAGLVSAGLTYPLLRNTGKFPTEIDNLGLKGLSYGKLVLKNRILQSLLGAPAGLLVYDAIKNKKKETPLNTIAAGSAASLAGALAASLPSAKYDALLPKIEAKAKIIGSKLEGLSPFFRRRISTGPTLGHIFGRIYKGTLTKLPAAVLGTGLGYIAYDTIKSKLDNKNK